MSLSLQDQKRLERKAKMLLMEKEIPQPKMDIVRSLLKNTSIDAEERYNAIIDLVKNCEDKKKRPAEDYQKRIEVKKEKKPVVKTQRKVSSKSVLSNGPTMSSVFVNRIFDKYKHLKLFKKRYLIKANNVFKIAFKKRLIPTKSLYRAVKLIISGQEKIMSRLPVIMDEILKDELIEDPIVYNYLKIMAAWLQQLPLITINFLESKWMDCKGFEREFKAYIIYFIQFMEMDTTTKERIIMIVEKKLREMTDLKKDDAGAEFDEKQNLEREKKIYDFMMTFRSYLPEYEIHIGLIDRELQKQFGIDTIKSLLLYIYEALIMKHETDIYEIKEYYSIKSLEINTLKWACSDEELRQVGKDDESKVRKYRERLKSELEPLEDIHKYIGLKVGGFDILSKAFDDQWKIINKRRQEYGHVFEENFFQFIDECLCHFSDIFVPFLDGSELELISPEGVQYFQPLFTKSYFENIVIKLNDILGDLTTYRINNPSTPITRDEARNVMKGTLSTFQDVKNFLNRIGDIFYDIAEELHNLEMLHIKWISIDKKDVSQIYKSADKLKIYTNSETGLAEENPAPVPLPFFNCRVGKLEMHSNIVRLHSGKHIWSESARDNVYKIITAFCYQMAYECYEERAFNALAHRKEIKHKLNELVGRL